MSTDSEQTGRTRTQCNGTRTRARLVPFEYEYEYRQRLSTSTVAIIINRSWQNTVNGDCRQELVFIGIGMDELALYDSLEACLLTDEEVSQGPESWQSFSDPFPAWNVQYRAIKAET